MTRHYTNQCLPLPLPISSPWFSLVRPAPNYWRSWTGRGPFVAGTYYHYCTL